jgi:recombination protein RecR
MSTSLPPAVIALQDRLSHLPGVGRKGALRMAMHLLKSDREEVAQLAKAVLDVKDKVKVCSICGFLSDRDPCPICTDQRRQSGIICVVEQPGDVIALEKGGIFAGRYHVLGGALAPLDGIGPEDLRIRELEARIGKEEIAEVIVATNPTPEGEQTAFYLSKRLKPRGVRVSRIARGVPVGSDLENADDLTLTRALEGRRELD